MNRRKFILTGIAGLAWVACRAKGAARDAKFRAAGSVTEAGTGRPLAGVAISNGYVFVQTNAHGRYEIDVVPGDYPFVFVNAPSGYRPSGSSFLRLATAKEGPVQIDFALAPDPRRTGERIRLAHVSDTHIGVKHLPHFASDEDLAADYRAVIAECAPDLLINTGDVSDAGREVDFQAVRALTVAVSEETGRPIFTVFGNHDADEDRAQSKRGRDLANNLRFQAVMGPDQFTFDWGDYHFIVSGFFWPGESFRRPRMEAWLAADLALQPPHKRIILLTHDKPRLFPEVQPCYAPSIGQMAAHPGTILALHGHHHTTCVLRVGKITVVGVPTGCVGGIDTSPRGYALVEIEGDRVQVELRPLTESGYRLGSPPARAENASPRLDGFKCRWSANLGTTLHRAAPIVIGSNVIFSLGDRLPFHRQGLVALDLEQGSTAWTHSTEAAVKNSVGWSADPGVADSCFVAEVTGRLSRIDAKGGGVAWRKELRNFPDRYIYATPVVSDRAVYVMQHQGWSAYESRAGGLIWAGGPAWDENRSAIYQLPAMDGERIYCIRTGFLGHYGITAYSREHGTPIWDRDLDTLPPEYPEKLYQSHFPSPIIAGAFLVLAGWADRLVVLRKADGRTIWDLPVLRRAGPTSGVHPAFYHVVEEHAAALTVQDDIIYATTSNGGAYAIELQTGRRLWEFVASRPPLLDFQPYFRGRGNILTSLAVMGRNVVIGGADGNLYFVDAPTGRLVQHADFGAPITAPSVMLGKRLIISCFDGRAFCYEAL